MAPRIAWIQFDDSSQWLAYNSDSADVHLLTPSAHLLWTLIAEGQARPLPDLLPVFAERAHLPLSEEVGAAVSDSLEAMDRAGLVQPAAE